MTWSPAEMLLMTMLIPAAAVVGIVASGRYPNIRETVTIGASLVVIYLVSQLYLMTGDGTVVAWKSEPLFADLSVAFRIEPLGMLFSLVAGYLCWH